jgi:hypothetical protein
VPAGGATAPFSTEPRGRRPIPTLQGDIVNEHDCDLIDHGASAQRTNDPCRTPKAPLWAFANTARLTLDLVAGTSTPAPATSRVVSLEESPNVPFSLSPKQRHGLTLWDPVQDRPTP